MLCMCARAIQYFHFQLISVGLAVFALLYACMHMYMCVVDKAIRARCILPTCENNKQVSAKRFYAICFMLKIVYRNLVGITKSGSNEEK